MRHDRVDDVVDVACSWSRSSRSSIYSDPEDHHRRGVRSRTARRRRSPAGWLVSGRWQWGSGCQHCQYILGGTTTDSGEFHLMFFDAADVTIHDTWYSSGLRGSGSHDYSVDGAFVPNGRSVQPFLGERQVDCALATVPELHAARGLRLLGQPRHRTTRDRRADRARPAQEADAHARARSASRAGRRRSWRRPRRCCARRRRSSTTSCTQAWETTLAGSRVDVAPAGPDPARRRQRGRVRGACRRDRLHARRRHGGLRVEPAPALPPRHVGSRRSTCRSRHASTSASASSSSAKKATPARL